LAKELLERYVFFNCFIFRRLYETTQVRVVEHKRSKKLYALKYIDKARCIKQKAVSNIIQERRLLEEVRTSNIQATYSAKIRMTWAGRPSFCCEHAVRIPG
jgi:hypothetical protein